MKSLFTVPPWPQIGEAIFEIIGQKIKSSHSSIHVVKMILGLLVKKVLFGFSVVQSEEARDF